MRYNTGEEIQLGDKVEINDPNNSVNGQLAMVRSIGEDEDEFPISVEMYSGFPYMFKPGELIFLSRFKLYVGDIWLDTDDSNQKFIIDQINPLFMRKLGRDYGFMRADYYSVAREVFIEKFRFDRRGPRVGDKRIMLSTLSNIEIVELDLSEREGVKYRSEGRDYLIPYSVQRLFNQTRLLDDFLNGIAKCQTYKKDGIDYIVDSVNGNIVKFHKSKTRSNRNVRLESSIRSFKERYTLVGPKPGEKYVHKISRGVYNHDFYKILGIDYGKLYALKNNKDKREILLCDFFKNHMLEPKPEVGQIWIDGDNQGIREKYEIMEVEESRVELRQLNRRRSYGKSMDRLLTNYGFYSDMPRVGQVFVKGSEEVVVRSVATDENKRIVFYSKVGHTPHIERDAFTLYHFSRDFVYMDSGREIKLPALDEKWKSIESEEPVDVFSVMPDDDRTSILFKLPDETTMNSRQYVFLRRYVPIGVRLPIIGDKYTSLLIEDSEMEVENVDKDVVYIGDRKYEMQTFIRDFQFLSGNIFLDLATLKSQTINDDSILDFINSLGGTKVTEEHIEMLQYLIDKGVEVDYKSLERIANLKLNDNVAIMIMILVENGADPWLGLRDSLVRHLLKKKNPLANKLLKQIIGFRMNYQKYFQQVMLEKADGEVMVAYFLNDEDGKLKNEFDPMEPISYLFYNRMYALLLRLKNDANNTVKVIHALIHHEDFKILKKDIKEWFWMAVQLRQYIPAHINILFKDFMKNTTKDKEVYLLKILMKNGFEGLEYAYKKFMYSPNAKFGPNATYKGKTIAQLLFAEKVTKLSLDFFYFLFGQKDYDPNIAEQIGKVDLTILGKLLAEGSFGDRVAYNNLIKMMLGDPRLRANTMGCGGFTYLQYLCKNEERVQFLRHYSERGDIEVDTKQGRGLTAMHVANYKIAWKLLYKKGADINAVSDDGTNVLEKAVLDNDKEKIRWLLKRENIFLIDRGTHIVYYALKRDRDPMPFLLELGPSYMMYGTENILFRTHKVLRIESILVIMEMDDFNPNMEMVPGRGDNYLSVVISSFYHDNLSDAGRMALIKLLLEKGSDKTMALRVAMNMGLTDVIELLISPRDRKIRDIEKKKRLELDKCSSYKKRVEKMDTEIEALNKLTDKEFEEKIGKAQMSKCQNEMDLITLEPWEALDYKNTLFLRVTDLQGKQRTYCLVEKFYKGESFEINGKKYEEPDEQTTISQYIKKMLYADWVYESDGRPYSQEDVYNKSGEDGKPGRKRYVVFTPSDGTTYYVNYDRTLKKIIKKEDQRVSSDDYANGYYNINGTILRLPKGWSLPLAIYITADKKLAIGNEAGNRGSSDSHGNVMVMTYNVDRIVNFNNYDDIEEERECLGKCKKLKM